MQVAEKSNFEIWDPCCETTMSIVSKLFLLKGYRTLRAKVEYVWSACPQYISTWDEKCTPNQIKNSALRINDFPFIAKFEQKRGCEICDKSENDAQILEMIHCGSKTWGWASRVQGIQTNTNGPRWWCIWDKPHLNLIGNGLYFLTHFLYWWSF